MYMTRLTVWAGAGASAIVLGASHAGECVLYENGTPDGTNGWSNATSQVFGARRTVLDDFRVPENAVWTIDGLRHWHIWNTLPPGSGRWMEIGLREDVFRTPGDFIIERLDVTGYEEVSTGRILFDREETESWTTFTPVELPPGRYWIEATIVGPENNFWLTRQWPPHYEPSWFNYEDLGGGPQQQMQFGLHHDLAWALCGATTACVGDVNEDGDVGFPDLQLILQDWGSPDPGLADVTNDGDVDVEDLLRLLSVWGPCPGKRGTGTD